MEPYSPLIAIESAKYDTPGKQKFRELLLAIAGTSDVRTYGTLWGGGTDARMAAAAGLQVTAAEVTRSLHEAMTNDAALHGYVPFTHRAGRLTEHFDMFHADFCGNASPGNFRELRHLASISRRWLAVTLAPDHQLDPSMQGEAAIYTMARRCGQRSFNIAKAVVPIIKCCLFRCLTASASATIGHRGGSMAVSYCRIAMRQETSGRKRLALRTTKPIANAIRSEPDRLVKIDEAILRNTLVI